MSTESQTVPDRPAVADSTGSVATAQDRRFRDVERSIDFMKDSFLVVSGTRLASNSLCILNVGAWSSPGQ